MYVSKFFFSFAPQRPLWRASEKGAPAQAILDHHPAHPPQPASGHSLSIPPLPPPSNDSTRCVRNGLSNWMAGREYQGGGCEQQSSKGGGVTFDSWRRRKKKREKKKREKKRPQPLPIHRRNTIVVPHFALHVVRANGNPVRMWEKESTRSVRGEKKKGKEKTQTHENNITPAVPAVSRCRMFTSVSRCVSCARIPRSGSAGANHLLICAATNGGGGVNRTTALVAVAAPSICRAACLSLSLSPGSGGSRGIHIYTFDSGCNDGWGIGRCATRVSTCMSQSRSRKPELRRCGRITEYLSIYDRAPTPQPPLSPLPPRSPLRARHMGEAFSSRASCGCTHSHPLLHGLVSVGRSGSGGGGGESTARLPRKRSSLRPPNVPACMPAMRGAERSAKQRGFGGGRGRGSDSHSGGCRSACWPWRAHQQPC